MSEQIKKLPWAAFTQESFSGWYAIQDSEGWEVGSGDGGFEKDQAEFIVHAVNSHDLLVGALKQIEKKMSEMYSLANEIGVNDMDGFYLGHSSDVIKQARAALAAAESQDPSTGEAA